MSWQNDSSAYYHTITHASSFGRLYTVYSSKLKHRARPVWHCTIIHFVSDQTAKQSHTTIIRFNRFYITTNYRVAAGYYPQNNAQDHCTRMHHYSGLVHSNLYFTSTKCSTCHGVIKGKLYRDSLGEQLDVGINLVCRRTLDQSIIRCAQNLEYLRIFLNSLFSGCGSCATLHNV